MSGTSASATIEEATISDNQRSGVRVYLGSASVTGSIVERNGNGISVNQGHVAASEHTVVQDNGEDGVWLNLTGSYTGNASSFLDSDITENGRHGLYLGIAENLATDKWPFGNRSNIFANASKQLYHYHTGQAVHEADWTMNYWGEGVDWAFNPQGCFGGGPQSRGHIAYLASGSNPPDGPITSKAYAGGGSVCAYDLFRIGPTQFYRTYIDGNTPPPAMSFASCRGGLHATTPTVCASDPVRTVSGSFVHEKVDLRLPGIGLPFGWKRTYHSQDTTDGPLGDGWTHSYAAALTIEANGDVTLRSEDGQQVEYVKQADGSYVGADGALSTLTKPGSSYELLRKDQVTYVFEASGRLTSMRDRNNQGLAFVYDGNGRLQTITDSAGRAITVTHNGSGNLTQVALPDGAASPTATRTASSPP